MSALCEVSYRGLLPSTSFNQNLAANFARLQRRRPRLSACRAVVRPSADGVAMRLELTHAGRKITVSPSPLPELNASGFGQAVDEVFEEIPTLLGAIAGEPSSDV